MTMATVRIAYSVSENYGPIDGSRRIDACSTDLHYENDESCTTGVPWHLRVWVTPVQPLWLTL
jgi:hypothetical protein